MSPSKGTKRKWNLIEGDMGQRADTLFSHDLGCYSTSSVNNCSSATALITISSSKETYDECSIDLKSVFVFQFENEKKRSVNSKKSSTSNLKRMEVQPMMEMDLGLQRSAFPSKFDSTTIRPSPHQLEFGTDTPVADFGALNANEGPSSDIKTGNILLPFQTSMNKETRSVFYQVRSTRSPAASVVPNPSPFAITDTKCAANSGMKQGQHPDEHSGSSNLCQVEGCRMRAIGAFGRCYSHGGRETCQIWGCRVRVYGRSLCCESHFCRAHKYQCEFQGCTRSVEGDTNFCIVHGDGRRCIHEGCSQVARQKSELCIHHSNNEGTTDFFQVHSEGKSYSWGHPKSKCGVQHTVPCDLFAISETGRCGLHIGLVEDERVHGGIAHQWLKAWGDI